MGSYVVTGVSSGIGLAIAEALVDDGHRVFGSVRRQSDGERLKAELGSLFTPLQADVTDDGTLAAAASFVAESLAGAPLSGLVNNAGIAFSGPMIEQSLAAVQEQFDVNLMGPLRATRAFAPLLTASVGRVLPRPRIVNMSSNAGRFAAPFLGVYAASKHGLEGLSGAMRREFMALGIDVIVVAPGAVRTPIWDKAEAGAHAPDPGSVFAAPLRKFDASMNGRGRKGMEPSTIARVVLRALTSQRPRTRYATGGAALAAVSGLLPVRLQDRLIAGMLGLTPKA